TITQFDNLQLSWSSTGGDASELKHYWRIQQIPNRPLSSYSLRFEGHHSANVEGDNFAVAFATDVVGGDPTTGTYTTILWVNTTTDLAQTYTFVQNLQNQIVWIRVIDLDHHVGNTSLDILFVDQMYIEDTTQPIQPGAVITLPAMGGQSTQATRTPTVTQMSSSEPRPGGCTSSLVSPAASRRRVPRTSAYREARQSSASSLRR